MKQIRREERAAREARKSAKVAALPPPSPSPEPEVEEPGEMSDRGEEFERNDQGFGEKEGSEEDEVRLENRRPVKRTRFASPLVPEASPLRDSSSRRTGSPSSSAAVSSPGRSTSSSPASRSSGSAPTSSPGVPSSSPPRSTFAPSASSSAPDTSTSGSRSKARSTPNPSPQPSARSDTPSRTPSPRPEAPSPQPSGSPQGRPRRSAAPKTFVKLAKWFNDVGKEMIEDGVRVRSDSDEEDSEQSGDDTDSSTDEGSVSDVQDDFDLDDGSDHQPKRSLPRTKSRSRGRSSTSTYILPPPAVYDDDPDFDAYFMYDITTVSPHANNPILRTRAKECYDILGRRSDSFDFWKRVFLLGPKHTDSERIKRRDQFVDLFCSGLKDEAVVVLCGDRRPTEAEFLAIGYDVMSIGVYGGWIGRAAAGDHDHLYIGSGTGRPDKGEWGVDTRTTRHEKQIADVTCKETSIFYDIARANPHRPPQFVTIWRHVVSDPSNATSDYLNHLRLCSVFAEAMTVVWFDTWHVGQRPTTFWRNDPNRIYGMNNQSPLYNGVPLIDREPHPWSAATISARTKAAEHKYNHSTQGKARYARYKATEKRKATRQRINADRRKARADAKRDI